MYLLREKMYYAAEYNLYCKVENFQTKYLDIILMCATKIEHNKTEFIVLFLVPSYSCNWWKNKRVSHHICYMFARNTIIYQILNVILFSFQIMTMSYIAFVDMRVILYCVLPSFRFYFV